MSNRYLSKKTKTRKGISPVIATVILVAVAVVIAAALAGFSSSLFGSYSQNAQLAITSITVGSTASNGGDGSMQIVNSGGSADTITSVAIQNYGSALASAPAYADVYKAPTPTTPSTIPANGEATITFLNLDDSSGAGSVDLVSGQSVTVMITTSSGQQFTLSTIVV